MQSFSAIIHLLQQLIQIDSQNGNELAVAQLIAHVLKDAGIQCEIDEFLPGRANLIAEVGNGDRVLGLAGHMDTVEIGAHSSWQHDPFGGEIDNDRLYGRGAADMKAGIAAMIATLIDIKKQKIATKARIRLILTAGEEYGAIGAARMVGQGKIDDLAGLVIGEQTDNQVLYAHAGSLNYQLTAHGQAVHSSHPERGQNALTSLFQFANAEATAFSKLPVDPLLGKVTHSITVVNGGSQVNTIPDQAILKGNIRPTSTVNNDQIIAYLRQIVAQIPATHQVKLEILHSFWPVATSPNNYLVQTALAASQKACAKYCPSRKVQLGIMDGATDASVYVRHCPQLPVVILGAGENVTAHTNDEYTTLSSLQALNSAYHQIVRKF